MNKLVFLTVILYILTTMADCRRLMPNKKYPISGGRPYPRIHSSQLPFDEKDALCKLYYTIKKISVYKLHS
jgi:hypothetical protein